MLKLQKKKTSHKRVSVLARGRISGYSIKAYFTKLQWKCMATAGHMIGLSAGSGSLRYDVAGTTRSPIASYHKNK